EGLTAYLDHYGAPPPAMFITHVHLDHVAGFERLFVANYFDPDRRGRMPLYVPVDVLPLLHRRVAAYPNVLAEGGANFWDAFRVVPVEGAFWHDGLRQEVLESRHHGPRTAFGLRLRGSPAWTGVTRPMPEALAAYADAGELIAHDCGLESNPSHSGIDDLEREYAPELLARCVLYHYASEADGQALRAGGHRVARPGEVFALPGPVPHPAL